MFIRLNTLKIFAFHGVYEEEAKNGNNFEIDLEVEIPDGMGSSDVILDTLDYAKLYKTVIDICGSRRYHLLEALAVDICTMIFKSFSEPSLVGVKIRKMNPPIGGDLRFVEVELRRERNNA